MVAADGVMMGDRAAETDQAIRSRLLDLRPLLDLRGQRARRQDRVVGRGTVRIGMREADRHGTRTANSLYRVLCGGHHRRVKILEAVPGDRRLERLAEYSHADDRIAEIR